MNSSITIYKELYGLATLEYTAIILLFLMGLTALLVFSAMRNRRSQYTTNVIYAKELQLRELAQVHNSHSMEIDLENLELFEVLGEGAFGIVRRGVLMPFGLSVAVKMLKGCTYL